MNATGDYTIITHCNCLYSCPEVADQCDNTTLAVARQFICNEQGAHILSMYYNAAQWN